MGESIIGCNEIRQILLRKLDNLAESKRDSNHTDEDVAGAVRQWLSCQSVLFFFHRRGKRKAVISPFVRNILNRYGTQLDNW